MNITGGIYKGRKVVAPDEKIVRPTLSKARESIFNVLFSMLGNFEDKTFLDMFAGSGIMGLEALSRGFSEVYECEKNPKVINILKDNYNALGVNPNLHRGDCLKSLKTIQKEFDVIYIDPPYFSGIYESSLEVIKKTKSLKNTGIVILEHVKEVDWIKLEYVQLKQKTYSNKLITFLTLPQ